MVGATSDTSFDTNAIDAAATHIGADEHAKIQVLFQSKPTDLFPRASDAINNPKDVDKITTTAPNLANAEALENMLVQWAEALHNLHEQPGDVRNPNAILRDGRTEELEPLARKLADDARKYTDFLHTLNTAAEKAGLQPIDTSIPLTEDKYNEFRIMHEHYKKENPSLTHIDLPEFKDAPKPPLFANVAKLEYKMNSGYVPLPEKTEIIPHQYTIREAAKTNGFITALKNSRGYDEQYENDAHVQKLKAFKQEDSDHRYAERKEQREGNPVSRQTAVEGNRLNTAMRESQYAVDAKFGNNGHRDEIKNAFTTLAEAVYKEAGGPDNHEYKKQFVDAFVDAHNADIDRLARPDYPAAARSRDLAQLASIASQADQLAEPLKGKLNDKLVAGTTDKYLDNPSHHASAVAANVNDIMRDGRKAEAVARNSLPSEQLYHGGQKAANDAVAARLSGKSSEQIAQTTKDKYPPRVEEDKLGQQASELARAEYIVDTGKPISMTEFRKHPDFENMRLGALERLGEQAPSPQEKQLMVQHRTANAANIALANAFGDVPANKHEEYQQKHNYASKTTTLAMSQERLALAEKIQNDSTTRDLAKYALSATGNNPEEAIKLMQDVAATKPEARKQMLADLQKMDTNGDHKFSAEEIKAAMLGKYDKDGDRKLSKDEQKPLTSMDNMYAKILAASGVKLSELSGVSQIANVSSGNTPAQNTTGAASTTVRQGPG